MHKNILITGGAGFIGSHLVRLMVNQNPKINIINIDSLTYAADITRLDDVAKSPNYKFIQCDIRDAESVDNIFKEHNIDGVMHLAAESHVDNSIKNPHIFVETNVMGTQNLLHSARNLWMDESHKLKPEYIIAKFLHVSTDEVYGTLGEEGYFTEDTPYAPNSPYSASKAASDMMARSYFHTFNLPVVISNCSNNYGPAQHDEKLIPTIIRKALAGEDIPIYGNGKNIRDWLYVVDHCIAINTIFNKGKLGESYNIGTDNEKTNIDNAHEICEILDAKLPKKTGKYSDQIKFVQDRAGHDFRYAIDFSKINKELGWSPAYTFKQALAETIDWYIELYKK